MDRIKRLETWARLGYAARGIVYVLLGWIALSSGRALSTRQAVKAVDDVPGATPLLVLLALGLFGYGAFKIYSALLDLDHKGDDAKGWAMRAVRVGGGSAYLFLAFVAARQAFGHGGSARAGQASGSGGSQQEVASQVAHSSGGNILLVIAGLAILIAAASQLWIAWKAKFSDEMPGAPNWVKPAGQVGYAARAIIVAITGYFAVKAGVDGDRVRTFGDAFALVHASHPFMFKLIAGGIILFGLVSMMMAMYRRVADDDVVARLKGQAPQPFR